ncbi:MAG: HAD-IA family hydrolase [Burkholderiaceae bacterium]|nr:HAD-IA family hydrolase [Burkholderiaceae bacterium]
MNINEHFQAIVFDFDGTLIDTLPSLAAAANAVLEQHGLAPVQASQLRPALNEGLRPLFRKALALQALAAPGTPAPDADRFEAACMAHYTDAWMVSAPLFDGAADCLQALRSRGLQLAICTNRDPASTAVLLNATGIAGHFDVVVGLGDAPRPKPAPDPLLQAMERLGTAPAHTLLVGDSAMDARCAASAQVRFAAHLGGYAHHPDDLLPRVFHFSAYRECTPWLLHAAPLRSEVTHA